MGHQPFGVSSTTSQEGITRPGVASPDSDRLGWARRGALGVVLGVVLLTSAGCSSSDSYKRGEERIKDFFGDSPQYATDYEKDMSVTCPKLLKNLRDRGETLVGEDFIEGCTDAGEDIVGG